MMSPIEIKMELLNDAGVESSGNLSLVLEGGERSNCYLTIVNNDLDIELCFVEISEELFWSMKKELGGEES